MCVCVYYPDRGKWVPPRTAWVGRGPCHPAACKGTAAPRPGTRYGRAEHVGPLRSCNEAPVSCTPTVGKLPRKKIQNTKMKYIFKKLQNHWKRKKKLKLWKKTFFSTFRNRFHITACYKSLFNSFSQENMSIIP